MKTFIIACILVLVEQSLTAQTSDLLEKRLSCRFENMPIADALQIISKQSGTPFYGEKGAGPPVRKVLDRELMVNSVNATNPQPIPEDVAMKSMNLADQLQPYDSAFWKNYNVLLRTPSQEQIVKDLGNAALLEKQFSGQRPEQPKKKKRR